ncbi:MAG: nuclear transport factor 2 family protein [Pyrinomonadaceae bacterium]
MTIATTKTTSEAQIRALIDERIHAVRNKDVTAAIAHTSDDVRMFDVVNPLQSSGSAASRKRAEEWFGSFDGPLGFEMTELAVAAGDEVAFAHGLSHVSASKADGGKLDMWWRTTLGFGKIDGKWMAVHEHNSVPFNMENGQASLDLKP